MTDPKPILEGIRVVEAASMIFIPSAAAILGDYGADVVKVEPPGEGDRNRYLHQLKGMPESDLPYAFFMDNRNKRGIALDLKSEEGLDILYRLIEKADVFMTNHRPSALKKLGLTYDELKAVNPKLIYAHGTGFGERGPEADKPGYDSVSYWTRPGIVSTLYPYEGWLGSLPAGSGDHPSGTAMFGAIMLALFARQRTGEGCRVDSSLLANGAWANSCVIQAQLCGANFLPKRPRHDAYNFISLEYRTRDKRLVKLTIVNIGKRWDGFCKAMGDLELAKDPRFEKEETRYLHMAELISRLDKLFAERDMAEWEERLTRNDIPFAIVPTYPEIEDDPQMKANDIFVPIEHPRFGPMKTVNSPFHLSNAEKAKPIAAPELGQHSAEILAELGYDAAAVDDFLKRGIAARPETESISQRSGLDR